LLLVTVGVVLAACGGPAQQRIQLELTSPSLRLETTDPEVTVTGIVSDSAATLKVAGTVVPVGSDGAFSHTVDLPYGTTRINVTAEREGHTSANRTINVTRKLVLAVTTPEKESATSENQITVNGTVSDKAARVFVTGTEVPLAEDGSFTTTVMLHYEETIIRVFALLDEMEPLSTLLTVTRAF
jgi:hypothetical protein